MMNKLERMVGLATRAGKVAFGSEMSVEAVRRGRAFVVLLANDASDRTKKLIRNKCASFGVRLLEYGSKSELGKITGKNNVSALAVLDREFANAVWRNYGGVINGESD